MDGELMILSLGSNIGDREGYLKRALKKLDEQLHQKIAISSIYETPPLGFKANSSFYNCAASYVVKKEPNEILKIIQQIEIENDRIRTEVEEGYQSRTLDIDIIYFGQRTIHEPGLEVPHQRRLERKFVLVPINEIHPDFIDPIANKPVFEIIKETIDDSEIKKTAIF